MTFLTEMNGRTCLISPDLDARKGAELSEAYRTATPFPHTMIDDFLPAEVLERCLEDFPRTATAGDVTFNRPQERLKTQFNPDALGDWARALFYSFNSRPFIRVLENITGIEGLIPDPYFLGGGFHEVAQGGHLSIHADFNHHRPLNLERRINVLIYLNKAWDEGYGGQLELWSPDMKHRVRSFTPEFNRCVIFSTDDTSYHGNPNPVDHPAGVSRRSIALYYYSATWSALRREHTTDFRARPGAGDRPNFVARELISDFLPPILARNLRRLKRASAG